MRQAERRHRLLSALAARRLGVKRGGEPIRTTVLPAAGPGRRRRLVCGVVLALGMLHTLPTAAAADPSASRRQADTGRLFAAVLDGAFIFGTCPQGAPAGAQCLVDEVHGRAVGLGEVTGRFQVVIDSAAFGANHCGPISKSGSFVGNDGARLKVHAQGRFCTTTNVADYLYSATGGSGRFTGLVGAGHWYVPAPVTFDGVSGTGPEYLYGFSTRRTR